MHKAVDIILIILISATLIFAFWMLLATESQAYEETYIDEEYVRYCGYMQEEFGIDKWVLVALIERESSGNPTARDYLTGTHVGLMQLSEYYFAEEGRNLEDPYTNIYLGTAYLVSCDDDIGKALMIYHEGNSAIGKTELSSYASGILERAKELKFIALQDSLQTIIERTRRNKLWKGKLAQF